VAGGSRHTGRLIMPYEVIECCHKVHRPKRVVRGEQGIAA
jgi:hypothetical protein